MSSTPANDRRRPHILALDNDKLILDLLRDRLEDEGYQVSTRVAVDKDLCVVGALQPDLIILDYLWGGEDTGWSYLQALRMDPRTAPIPIVLCTGAIKEVDALQPQLDQLGVRVVHKPFNIDELLAVIADVLAPHSDGIADEPEEGQCERGGRGAGAGSGPATV
jgi:CheY-like chemotaxis protein